MFSGRLILLDAFEQELIAQLGGLPFIDIAVHQSGIHCLLEVRQGAVDDALCVEQFFVQAV